MGFGEAIHTVLKDKYATFSGRASRSEFWWFQLFYFLLSLVFVVAGSLSLIGYDEQAGLPILTIIIGVIAGVVVLATLIPFSALQVRRLHDRNMSGWWYLGVLLFGLIPFVGGVASIALFVINMLRGTDGPNKFGPDPLRPYANSEVFA